MAKQLVGDRSCQIIWDGASAQLRYASYPEVTDSVDPDIIYKRVSAGQLSRALTAEELSGTLQAFLDGLDAAHKTAEGIA